MYDHVTSENERPEFNNPGILARPTIEAKETYYRGKRDLL
jgi:hypothetical protein